MFDDGRFQKTRPPIVIGQCRYTRGIQQPRQIDPLILSTFASSRSIAGLVPSSGPFMGLPVPDDESAVPRRVRAGCGGDGAKSAAGHGHMRRSHAAATKRGRGREARG